ncbi:Uncharacterized protein BM_BM17870 [Brugia malayi]|uniref:Uncharacterized protein n=1 Tax=Brugia malayi TaxID=6279 RepID=A0A4E9ESL8_BRUMA|nr:Uncharacterized protein BM_BM17870 [Brugia malayi]VIO85792.1 Uncharacterized protein BM_BM17870 [Brugia malayi]
MNVSLYHYRGKWIMIDLGIGFADETMPVLSTALQQNVIVNFPLYQLSWSSGHRCSIVPTLLTLELPSKPVWNPQFLQMQHCQQLLYRQYYLLPNNDDGF